MSSIFVTIQPKNGKADFRVGLIVMEKQKRHYDVTILFDLKKGMSDRERITGLRFMSMSQNTVMQVLKDIGNLYPPKREIVVEIPDEEVEDFLGSNFETEKMFCKK